MFQVCRIEVELFKNLIVISENIKFILEPLLGETILLRKGIVNIVSIQSRVIQSILST